MAAITSNLRLASAPGNVELEAGDANLPKACVINISQLLAIDRSRLSERIGALDIRQMHEVEHGLRLVLDLYPRSA